MDESIFFCLFIIIEFSSRFLFLIYLRFLFLKSSKLLGNKRYILVIGMIESCYVSINLKLEIVSI